MPSPREAARTAEEQAAASTWLDRAAAAGLVAFGVIHLVLAWLAVRLATGDREGSATTTGAVRELADQPFGGPLVWAVALGMVLLAGWQAVEAAVGWPHDDDTGHRTRRRLVAAGKAAVYGVVAAGAVGVATGSGGGGGGGTEGPTARLMSAPAGQVLVGAVGLGVIAVGVTLIASGLTGRFLHDVAASGRTGRTGTVLEVSGRIGHVAKGAALGVVGGLFGYAALTHDPDESGGLDQALSEILRQPAGPVLVAAVGVGFAGYGVFCLLRARHLDRQ